MGEIVGAKGEPKDERPARYFDDSPTDREVTSMSRLWNRSSREGRAEFLEIAKEAEGGLIDI